MKKQKLEESTNSSLQSLIPKDIRHSVFSRFSHVPLRSKSYKILTKILTNEVKSLLSSLISKKKDEDLFTKSKIIDKIIMVQEDIHSSRINKEKGMIMKINMANAFNHV